MKKTILIILIAMVMPVIAAAKIGDYAGVDCGTGMEYCSTRYLSDKDETFKRIHNLEYEVKILRQQLAQATCSCAVAEARPDLEQRVSALEQAVSTLEQLVLKVQKAVLQTMQIVIGIFQNIIK